MNWKLIFQLSLFGLAMALATISLIPQNAEPFFWLVIFIVCAYVVAKRCQGRYFVHGFMISIFNAVWITAAHTLFANTFIANHPQMASMNQHLPLAHHPRLLMVIFGPVFGAICGIVLGAFCSVAARLMKSSSAAA